LDEETMFSIKGERVEAPDLSFGRPTKYLVVRPENFVFVDETGCNTGGQRFILPKEYVGVGITGAVTDIHSKLL
jgi:hypothetical protein